MRLLLLIIAIVIFLVMAFLGIIGSVWLTPVHLAILLGLGLAAFAAAFLPLGSPPAV